MFKKVSPTIFTVLMMVSLFASSAIAQAESDGCIAFNSGTYNKTKSVIIPSIDLAAGETISVTATSSVNFSGDPEPLNYWIDGVSQGNQASQFSFTVQTTGTYALSFYENGAYYASWIFTCTLSEGDASAATGRQPTFHDGRLNDYDSASPVIPFPVEVNGEIALHIYSAEGELVLIVTPEQIANAPENPESNVIIAESNGISFARITGDGQGLWQLTAPQYNGKTYVLIFPEFFSNAGYTSYEE